MNNINKTNYFTQAWYERFPKASKYFCNWIDQYKKEVNWNDTLNRGGTLQAPKFHDIPFELQYGVLCKFAEGFKKVTIPPYSFIVVDLNMKQRARVKLKRFVDLNKMFSKIEKQLNGVAD